MKNNMEKVLILDFGSNDIQLLARQVRKDNVYCEILPFSTSIEKISKVNPLGIILAGDTDDITKDEISFLTKDLLNLNIPVLAMDFASSIIVKELNIKDSVSNEKITVLNKNLYAIDAKISSISDEALHGFLYNVCKCSGQWKLSQYAKTLIADLKQQIGDKKILLALSGGVDSTVCAVLISKAVGKQLTCILVDHGLMRKNEANEVEELFKTKYDVNFIRVNAQQQFYKKLAGIDDPETKRKTIGEEFIRVFEKESKKLGTIDFFAQGTIYPDIIESGHKKGTCIKSHHNVGGLPEHVDFKEIVEPLKMLFKDEVRNIGRELGIPNHLVERQPFPGPGLGVRISGEITEEKVKMVQEADYIFREEIDKANLPKKPSQYFATITNLKSVGVRNNRRTYERAVTLRAIYTVDFMSADVVPIPYEILDRCVRRIITEVDGVNRVLFDITPKPLGTIELE